MNIDGLVSLPSAEAYRRASAQLEPELPERQVKPAIKLVDEGRTRVLSTASELPSCVWS